MKLNSLVEAAIVVIVMVAAARDRGTFSPWVAKNMKSFVKEREASISMMEDFQAQSPFRP
jgi:hypothetical protein